MERETEMEIDYFIKIEKRNVQNIAKTGPEKQAYRKQTYGWKIRVSATAQ